MTEQQRAIGEVLDRCTHGDDLKQLQGHQVDAAKLLIDLGMLREAENADGRRLYFRASRPLPRGWKPRSNR